ncbi:hypothetical protein Pmani_000741 [Petrolisthes manimaculis]|uniref:Uncharacterized protein n=1 Tax=Petrolisthes manimaculis TaxID=1843537 RepID=A0AAE1QLE4_9EUCA|nr:hypothetical protein Pmani_000741 [Petrolisthes manimaculis]
MSSPCVSEPNVPSVTINIQGGGEVVKKQRRNTTSYQVKKSTPEYHHITAHQDLSRHCQAIRILNNNEKIPRRMQNSRQVPQVNTVKKKNASQTLLGISW